MTEEQNLIQRISASKNERELAERYDERAKTYEGDLCICCSRFTLAHTSTCVRLLLSRVAY